MSMQPDFLQFRVCIPLVLYFSQMSDIVLVCPKFVLSCASFHYETTHSRFVIYEDFIVVKTNEKRSGQVKNVEKPTIKVKQTKVNEFTLAKMMGLD